MNRTQHVTELTNLHQAMWDLINHEDTPYNTKVQAARELRAITHELASLDSTPEPSSTIAKLHALRAKSNKPEPRSNHA